MTQEAARAEAASLVRRLRVRARRDVTTSLTGGYRSAFRGQGLTFEELRDYAPGDDVRWIEWNATARLGRPIAKRMREERDLVLALLIDVSPSLDCGPADQTKEDAVQRACAALASAAIASQDRVALALFGEKLEHVLSPGTGALQRERVLRALEQSGGAERTDAGPALDWAAEKLPRHSVVVLISDFLFPDPGAALRRCASKHDLVALRVRDPSDDPPPGLPPLRVRGAEGRRARTWRRAHDAERALTAPVSERALRALGADYGELWTGARLMPSLLRFFEERARRRT
ncbi:MAG TPA: DUF58 domain-containing protein [Myxococcota bacterium]|nr:DUF58 domain-containing protein [Myxococcota bacterium]